MCQMKKVLIVDDDEPCLEILQILAKESTYDVVATTIPPTLNEIKIMAPDLIVIDEWLATVKGSDICKLIKVDATLNHIPVILISAVNGLSQIAAECCADAFIEKPFNIDFIAEVIYNTIEMD